MPCRGANHLGGNALSTQSGAHEEGQRVLSEFKPTDDSAIGTSRYDDRGVTSSLSVTAQMSAVMETEVIAPCQIWMPEIAVESCEKFIA